MLLSAVVAAYCCCLLLLQLIMVAVGISGCCRYGVSTAGKHIQLANSLERGRAYQSESLNGAEDDIFGHERDDDAFRQPQRSTVEIHDYHVKQL